MTASPSSVLPIAVLISGGGSTLCNLLELTASGRLSAQVCGVVASRECAGLDHARAAAVPWAIVPRVVSGEGKSRPIDPRTTGKESASEESRSHTAFDPHEFSARVSSALDQWAPQLIVFGGFLSPYLPAPHYRGRVLNIHPALLPQFGGPGMYGDRVHQAVLASGAQVSGCTVHLVDDEYDHGAILAQRVVPVLPGDTVATLGARVRQIERELYPEVIGWLASGRLTLPVGAGTELAPRDLLGA